MTGADWLAIAAVFIFIVPGVIAVALAKRGPIGGLAPLVGANGVVPAEAAQAVYPMLVHVMPAGLRGVLVAALLAAVMSSLAAALNASSTLFTMDFYQKIHPSAPQARLVWIGRAATAAMVLPALLWIPVIQVARGLYEYLQGVQAYLAPPIFAVFVFGVTMRRVNAAGCLAALVIGFALGAFRLIVDTPVMLRMSGFEAGYTSGSFL
jgi:SSS family solute:Na+ symporter